MPVEISVIIPLYNKEEFIERTLRSVAAQDIDNWECIIIDDGSTDLSLKKVNTFVSTHPGNWKVIKQVNSGQARARNHGVKIAQGKYIAFLDADDLWPTNKLRLQFNALEKNSDAVLVLSAFAIFRDHHSIPRVVRHKNSNKMNLKWLLMSGFGGGLESVGMIRSSSVLRKELFDSLLSTSSGLDLSLRMAQVGQIVLLPQIGLYYRISEGQWHGDASELGKNLNILSDYYQGAFKSNLSISHAAYLFWLSARGLGKKFVLMAAFKSMFTLRNKRFQVLTSLVTRNVTSKLRGLMMQHETLTAINSLDS